MIFVSYASEDRHEVKKLYDRLRLAGYDPWMDFVDIVGGEDWERSIERSLNNADLFLACLSSNSVQKRGFLQKEVLQALDKWREKLPDDIYLIPVRLEECAMPERLAKFQAIDLFREDGWERLLDALRTGAQRLVQERSPVRTEEPNYQITSMDLAEQDPEIYSMKISYPRIIPDREASVREINLRLAGWVTQEIQDLRACRIWSREERKRRQILPDMKFPLTQLSCSYSVSLFTAELLSLNFVIWYYGSGAAHGNTRFKTFNLLLNPPTSLDLNSIFSTSANYLPLLAGICRDDLLQQEGGSPKFIEGGTTPEYEHFKQFILTETGMRFLFPPYQVGPFSWGPREVSVPYSSLRSVINKDGPLHSLL
jgi:TIR domain/Protein of unknown function (DUF3298)